MTELSVRLRQLTLKDLDTAFEAIFDLSTLRELNVWIDSRLPPPQNDPSQFTELTRINKICRIYRIENHLVNPANPVNPVKSYQGDHAYVTILGNYDTESRFVKSCSFVVISATPPNRHHTTESNFLCYPCFSGCANILWVRGLS